jgi:hypothetical protein
MFANAGWHVWKRSLWVEWVPWLCYGVFFLLVPFRETAEAPATYFGKPRTLVGYLLLIAGAAVFAYSLLVSTR